MELIKKELPKNYELIQCGDLHLGSPNCSEDSIQEMIEYVGSNPNVYLVNIGDNVEAISPRDKRFNFSSNPYQTTQQQAERVIQLFMPIRDKILAWGTGNHEICQMQTCDWGKYMADALKVPYGLYCYKLEVSSRGHKLMHKLWFTHGSGHLTSNAKDDIQREGNMKASLKGKLSRSAHADCVYVGCGHIHRSIIVKPTVENKLYINTDDAGNIKQHYHVLSEQNIPYIAPDSRFYVASPSFMKLYSKPGNGYVSYAEIAGYEPSEIGYTKIIVDDTKVVDVKAIIL